MKDSRKRRDKVLAKKEKLKKFKNARWGTTKEEWDLMKLETLLEIELLLIDIYRTSSGKTF